MLSLLFCQRKECVLSTVEDLNGFCDVIHEYEAIKNFSALVADT